MSDTLQCYWCGHHPVVLNAPCPSCKEHITEIVPPGMGAGFLGRFEVRAWKEIVQVKDREILAFFDSISQGDP